MRQYVKGREDVRRVTDLVLATGYCGRRIAGVPRAVQIALHLCDLAVRRGLPEPKRIKAQTAREMDEWLDGRIATMPSSIKRMKHGMAGKAGDVFSTEEGCYRLDGDSATFVRMDSPEHAALVERSIATLRQDLAVNGIADAATIEIGVESRWWGDDVTVDGLSFDRLSHHGTLPGATRRGIAKTARHIARSLEVARSERARKEAGDGYDALRQRAGSLRIPEAAVSTRPYKVDLEARKVTHWRHTIRGRWHDLREHDRDQFVQTASSSWIPSSVEEGLRIMAANRRSRWTNDMLRADPVIVAAAGGVEDARTLLDEVGEAQARRSIYEQVVPSGKTSGGTRDRFEWLTLQYGLLAGKVRLGSGITWTHRHLMLGDNALPENVLSALVGNPVTDVVDHPWLGAWPIVGARRTKLGRVRLVVDATDVELGRR